MKFRSTLPAALVTVALLLGSACSSDDDDAKPDTTTTQAEGGAGGSTEPGGDDAGDDTPDTGGDTTEAEYVEALKGGMVDSAGPTGEAQFTQEQADCLAPRIVSTVGVDRLEEQNISTDELERQGTNLGFEDFGLDDETANAVYDSYGACDIDMVKFFVDGITADAALDDETKACVDGVVTDEKLRAVMVGLMVEGEEEIDSIPEVAAFGAELEACAG